MMDGYNAKSCNALEKPFYRPVEAALRWCGLIAYESQILMHIGEDGIPKTGQFPQWPCLQANTEKILDAIMHGSIPHGRDGRTVAAGDHVAKVRLTVRHSDLREWMAKHYPDQKPAFLFDEIERKTHAAINADAFRALQADRDALRTNLQRAEVENEELSFQIAALEKQIAALEGKQKAGTEPSDRSEKTYLNVIGGLLAMLTGKSPSGKPQSVFENQAAVISALLAHYEHIKGMGDSNLEKILAQANKSLRESLNRSE